MLIGVISDTHDNLKAIDRASKIFIEHKVNLVIHLGDIISPFSLARLAENLKGVKIIAIYGNNCGEKIGLQTIAKNYGVEISDPPRILELDGKRILLLHGWGPPDLTKEIVESLLLSGKWEAIFYGHTHQRDLKYFSGRLLLNPGEAAGVLQDPSIAIVNLDTLKAKFISLV